jgi:hypothetical protein
MSPPASPGKQEASVAATLFLRHGLQIGARREAATGPRQDHRPHGVVRLDFEKHSLDFEEEAPGECIACHGSVEGERRHAALSFEEKGGLSVRFALIRHATPSAFMRGSPADVLCR